MACLTHDQIQALADGEADAALEQHAASCARCTERVRERQAAVAALRDCLTANATLPHQLTQRIEAALTAAPNPSPFGSTAAGRGTFERLGATRLRSGGREPSRRRAFWSAAGAVAATLIAVLFVAPLMKGPTTVSASEILAASANRLAESPSTGVEALEYELVLDGVPREMMPDQRDGTYRVKQLFDHGTKGRYHLTLYGPDGQIESSIAQDPVNGRRTMLMRMDDRFYRFDFTLPATAPLSLPEIERLHMQASVAMMQASGDQLLQTVSTAAGPAYRIDVPRVEVNATNAVWDLSEAHALIDASDYRILELAVKGTFLKQPYSISFRLLRRDLTSGADVPASDFEIPDTPGAVRFQGEGSAIPARDAFFAVLREVAKSRQER
jgi:hypothetical protein